MDHITTNSAAQLKIGRLQPRHVSPSPRVSTAGGATRVIVRRLQSPSITSRDDIRGEVAPSCSRAPSARPHSLERDPALEAQGDAPATSSRSKSPMSKEGSFVLSLPLKPGVVLRAPSAGKEVAEGSHPAPPASQQVGRSLSPQRRAVPLVRRPIVMGPSSRFSPGDGWSSNDIAPTPPVRSAQTPATPSQPGRSDTCLSAPTSQIKVSVPGVHSARTTSPVRPAAASRPCFTGHAPHQISSRLSAPAQCQGTFRPVQHSPRGSPEVVTRGPMEMTARTPPLVSSPRLPSHRATLPAKPTQSQQPRPQGPSAKASSQSATSAQLLRTSQPSTSSSSSAGPILTTSPRELENFRMTPAMSQRTTIPERKQAVPLTARTVIAELEEARRLGDRAKYEEALAKAEAVGGHTRRSQHRSTTLSGCPALVRDPFCGQVVAAPKAVSRFERGETEGDPNAALDASDTLSATLGCFGMATSPGCFGNATSPRSIEIGSFQVSASMDVSASLNFELSPIKRTVDSPSRKVVDAVPVRPKFDLSGLSDSICTSNGSTPENSVVIDTVIEKMCDSGFGIDTEELLSQDGTRGGSAETTLSDSVHAAHLRECDTMLTVGDTGSTELRVAPIDEGLKNHDVLESDLQLIDEKIQALRGLDDTLEKSDICSFELCDDPATEENDDEQDEVSSPVVGGSIPIECTMLLYLRNFDCSPTMMTVIVPEGLREDRLIRVPYERKNFEFVVPPGVFPGEQLSVSIPRIPPLDSLSKVQIMNQLSHPLKWRQSFSDDGQEQWICDETRKECRMQHYQEMRGSNMNPTVATVYEDEVVLDEPFTTPFTVSQPK